MLVLSRKVNQRIMLTQGPNPIIVDVLEIRGNRVRLGISAPKEFTIDREEVYNEKVGGSSST